MFEIIGIAATAIVIFILVKITVDKVVNYHNNNNAFLLTVFGFGVIIARSPATKKELNSLRKTTDKNVFIDAPAWFNLHVYNLGVKKD